MEVAAGVVAFCQAAAAIAQTIIKAKQLWDQMKEVPEEISYLMEQLQQMGSIFSGIEKQLQDPDIPPEFERDSSAKQSLLFAQRACEALKSLVDDLSKSLECKKGFRRKTASFKIVVKQDASKKYEKRLQRSVSLLNTSLQAYNIALTWSSQKVLVRTVTDGLREIEGPIRSLSATVSCHEVQPYQDKTPEETIVQTGTKRPLPKFRYTPSILGRFAIAYGQGSGAWRARLQWPSWLSDTVSEMHYSQTMAGWTYSYRAYNIVAPDSEIMRTVKSGDTQGVLKLFSSQKASPFDKDSRGNSLLHYAAEYKNYDLCRHLLKCGLQDALDDPVGAERRSPLSVLVHQPDRKTPEKDWADIIVLFQSYLEDPDVLSVGRLFDFMREFAHNDDFVLVFQRRFFPKYYSTPVRDRLEAVRLGSFCLQSPSSFLKFLDEDGVVTESDVGLSVYEKLSLIHSSAIALGFRFTDEVLPRKKTPWEPRAYFEDWSDLVVQIASVTKAENLHSVEVVTPWDVHHVPDWRGTPLVSVIGGALSRISPGISFCHWDMVFNATMRRWLEDLATAGIDLEEYGTKEKELLCEQLRGAFDADAIESSRFKIREVMSKAAYGLREQTNEMMKWNINHWVPIRLIDITIGPRPDAWRLVWAPEFEHMACQFWELVEKVECVMPGSWLED